MIHDGHFSVFLIVERKSQESYFAKSTRCHRQSIQAHPSFPSRKTSKTRIASKLSIQKRLIEAIKLSPLQWKMLHVCTYYISTYTLHTHTHTHRVFIQTVVISYISETVQNYEKLKYDVRSYRKAFKRVGRFLEI